MNAARILILVAAAVAAVVAAYFVYRASSQPAAPTVQVVERARPSQRVLVAATDLAVGARVRPQDLAWQAWPEEGLSPAYIVESRNPDGMAAFVGALVRSPLSQGEPVTASRLVQSGDSGFMAATLTPGMRAIAVPISARTGAGGFILPNDRVDVLVTYEDENSSGRRRFFIAETVVENVRVLAIDQAAAVRETDDSVIGSSATLELTPDQVRAVSLAQARGDISLALRSLSDREGGPRLAAAPPRARQDERPPQEDMYVYRYGQGRVVVLGDE